MGSMCIPITSNPSIDQPQVRLFDTGVNLGCQNTQTARYLSWYLQTIENIFWSGFLGLHATWCKKQKTKKNYSDRPTFRWNLFGNFLFLRCGEMYNGTCISFTSRSVIWVHPTYLVSAAPTTWIPIQIRFVHSPHARIKSRYFFSSESLSYLKRLCPVSTAFCVRRNEILGRQKLGSLQESDFFFLSHSWTVKGVLTVEGEERRGS